MMDVVITYVDGRDPLWQQDYAKVVGGAALTKRYRDWGTLKYLLRGIEKHLPFVGKVFLVVARDSQVPEWINRENVHVVLHSDIIPPQFLPTFNSSVIEMFLHKIPGLAEEFLYFNDDIFPLRDCKESDFFSDGKIVAAFSRHILAPNAFKHRVRNSDRQARLCLGKKAGLFYYRPKHTVSPMFRSMSEAIFEFSKDKIYEHNSPIRTDKTFNQYLFMDYIYHSGKVLKTRGSNKHFSPAVHSVEKICAFIESPTRNLACINDVQMSEEKFELYRSAICASFEKHFPERSRFERDL